MPTRMCKLLACSLFFWGCLAGCGGEQQPRTEQIPAQPPALEGDMPTEPIPIPQPESSLPEVSAPPSAPETLNPFEETTRVAAPTAPQTLDPMSDMPAETAEAANPLLAPIPNRAAAPTSPELSETAIADQLLGLINSARKESNLPPLLLSDTMQLAAQIRAAESAASLSHIRPDQSPYQTAFDEAGYPYAGKWHGENMAVVRLEGAALDASAIASALYSEWLTSEGHQSNILSENFLETGIGVHIWETEGQRQVGAVQLFASA